MILITLSFCQKVAYSLDIPPLLRSVRILSFRCRVHDLHYFCIPAELVHVPHAPFMFLMHSSWSLSFHSIVHDIHQPCNLLGVYQIMRHCMIFIALPFLPFSLVRSWYSSLWVFCQKLTFPLHSACIHHSCNVPKALIHWIMYNTHRPCNFC